MFFCFLTSQWGWLQSIQICFWIPSTWSPMGANKSPIKPWLSGGCLRTGDGKNRLPKKTQSHFVHQNSKCLSCSGISSKLHSQSSPFVNEMVKIPNFHGTHWAPCAIAPESSCSATWPAAPARYMCPAKGRTQQHGFIFWTEQHFGKCFGPNLFNCE